MSETIAALANEPALVAQARVEPRAFAAIYDHYFPRVYTYVRYRVADDQTADDLTAHVFERALARIDEYRPDRAPFGAWLIGIARYAVNNHLRAERRHRWLTLDFLRNRPAPDPLPEEAVAQQEDERRLLAALPALGDDQRDLIALKYVAGLNNRTIARLTGRSESNVGVRLFRTLRQLRSIMGEEE